MKKYTCTRKDLKTLALMILIANSLITIPTFIMPSDEMKLEGHG